MKNTQATNARQENFAFHKPKVEDLHPFRALRLLLKRKKPWMTDAEFATIAKASPVPFSLSVRDAMMDEGITATNVDYHSADLGDIEEALFSHARQHGSNK